MIITSDKRTSRIPLPMPWGWFHVAYSHELGAGESKPITYFDQELVVFRTESGVARVVDAYCPHMGAHLGYGIRDNSGGGSSVVGESIVCPFHGWAFNGEGKCTDIPYAKNMPPKVARGEQVLGCWQVREVNRSIMVWYHPHGVDPLFEPPVVDELADDSGHWGELSLHQWDIGTHMEEIGENAVDPAHFEFVHGTEEIPNAEVLDFNGYERRGFLNTRQPTPKGVVDASIENLNFGAGIAVVRFKGLIDTVLMAHLTPVTNEFTRAHYAFLQPKPASEGMARLGKALVDNICQQMEEDKIIWDRKKYYEKPLLCDGDGPFAKFRKWYGQFLVE